MKTEHLILIGLALYFWSKKPKSNMVSGGGSDWQGPLQTIEHTQFDPPPGGKGPLPGGMWSPPWSPPMQGAPYTGTGLQMCLANDGGAYEWSASQNCPNVDFVQDGVPYTIGADGTPIPLTY